MAKNSAAHNDRDLLELVLEALFMIQYCRDPATATKHKGYHPMDAMVGEMDWMAEYQSLLEEAFAVEQKDPNSYMFGGGHYRENNPLYQHWDMAADYGLNYFMSATTKYVSRWRRKNGFVDIQKAVHYTEKLLSLYDEGRGAYRWEVREREAPGGVDDRLYRWCAEQELTELETEIVIQAVVYRTREDLLRLLTLLGELATRAASTSAERLATLFTTYRPARP